jgi:hypothetical protein
LGGGGFIMQVKISGLSDMDRIKRYPKKLNRHLQKGHCTPDSVYIGPCF